MTTEVILIFASIYCGVTIGIIGELKCDLSFLNPIEMYDRWYNLNWFGVGVATILLNIIFLPYAIIYWICKLIYWSFTVGRK